MVPDTERRYVGPSERARPAGRRRRTAVLAVAAAGASLTLSGCSAELTEQFKRVGLLEPASDRADFIGDLWVGTWIAALIIGVIVWALILFASFAYRRRDPDLPPQTRYNLPIEALYTIVPLFIIGAFFFWTYDAQKNVQDDPDPDLTVAVVGQQWSWTFNYTDEDVYDVGTAADRPTLVLPVDQVVRFTLESPDVIHSFWVPAFYYKMDVIPGRTNSFTLTPTVEGTFQGKCAELCGTYHSRMLFDVDVVSAAEYEQHIDDLRAKGQTGTIEAPLRAAYGLRPNAETGADDGGEQ